MLGVSERASMEFSVLAWLAGMGWRTRDIWRTVPMVMGQMFGYSRWEWAGNSVGIPGNLEGPSPGTDPYMI